MTNLNDIFGETISEYTTAEAIADGFLDVLDYEEMPSQRFKAGQILITDGMSEKMNIAIDEDFENYKRYITTCLKLHLHGFWGNVCPRDGMQNDAALKRGGRILSSFPTQVGSHENFWIITESDRSTTTILLPSEY
jgi:hypothetical protein